MRGIAESLAALVVIVGFTLLTAAVAGVWCAIAWVVFSTLTGRPL